jgi:DNA-binding GntR family transcriptional regulator
MIEHSDLSYPVYLRLKEMILKGEIKPGQKLLQEKLALELGVSRTPLLKALQMLEHDYLVESVPRRGMFVKKMSEKEMNDIYDVREGIESIAVRLVAERITEKQLARLKSLWDPFVGQDEIDKDAYRKADEKFHALLLEYSQNQVLLKTYSRSLVEARVVQMGLQRAPSETLQEHLDLVNAIEKRDADGAEKVIKQHIRRSKKLIAQNFVVQEQATEI